MPGMMLKSRRFLFWPLYAAYLLLTLLIVDYSFYLYYSGKIDSPPRRNNKSELLSLHSLEVNAVLTRRSRELTSLLPVLGWLPGIGNYDAVKQSSFENFTERKGRGVMRIGCFGDSFVYGAEVDWRNDYPGFLGDLFRKNNKAGVEVLNFGVGYFSFHQSFALWDNAGRNYGLDYLVVGPGSFWHKRNSTFNHTFEKGYLSGNPRYLHARYILENGDARMVEVAGRTPQERVGLYFRFFPPMRYLRYDSEAPAFLRAPIAFFFPERKLLRNPFYYRDDLYAEMDALYGILLSKIADSTPRVLIATYDRGIFDLVTGLKRENVSAVLLYRPLDFPYLAFTEHNAPLGNEIVARQLFDAISGKQESRFAIIATEDVSYEGPAHRVALEKKGLEDYRKVELEAAGLSLGQFYNTGFPQDFYCSGKNCDPVVKTFEGVKSIIAIRNGSASILDSVFLPLKFQLTPGMPLKIRFKKGGLVAERNLGDIRMLNPNLNIASAYFEGSAYNNRSKSVEIGSVHIPYPAEDFRSKGTLMTLLLGDVPIMSAQQTDASGVLDFRPPEEGFIVIRGDGRMKGGEKSLPDSGTIYLSLYYDDASKPVRIPFAQWSKSSVKEILR